MSAPKLLTPAMALGILAAKWASYHATWLVCPDEHAWPLTLVLNSLTEKDVLKDLPGTRDWVTSWRHWSVQTLVTWESRRWNSGNQELPMRLVIQSADELAALLGHLSKWAEARRRCESLVTEFPQFAASKALVRQCDKAFLESSRDDFERLLRLLRWLRQNPTSMLYLRQLPVEDVDTKWVEARAGLVCDLAIQLFGAIPGTPLHTVCGLRLEPARLRMRVLCPRLRNELRGLCDIEAPIGEIDALQLEPTTFLVVENRNTGVALPDLPGAVAFMRLGLAVDQLGCITWLHRVPRQLYWGDIDTHGFIALARARMRFPRMESLLMDEGTLLSHRSLCVEEPTPSRVERPEALTDSELQVYEGLRTGRWGPKVRLEQERIAWPAALAVLHASVMDKEVVGQTIYPTEMGTGAPPSAESNAKT